MIKQNDLAAIKSFVNLFKDTLKMNMIFSIVEDGSITWQAATKGYELDSFHIGHKVSKELLRDTLDDKQMKTNSFPENVFGALVKITSIPIVDDNGMCSSVMLIIIDNKHPLLGTFNYFAPIITQLFASGAFVSITDKEKVVHRQGSEQYDFPAIQEGFDITGDETISDILEKGEVFMHDENTQKYGSAYRNLIVPYRDEDTHEVLGCINIIRPKQIELDVFNMASGIEANVTEVSTAIEQLASAASAINSNEQSLNSSIKEIEELTYEIEKIGQIIESIANKSNILGLNAAIKLAELSKTL